MIMKINAVYDMALLSEASYSVFYDSVTNEIVTDRDSVINALKADLRSQSLATSLADNWRVAHHQPNTDSGYSATLLE